MSKLRLKLNKLNFKEHLNDFIFLDLMGSMNNNILSSVNNKCRNTSCEGKDVETVVGGNPSCVNNQCSNNINGGCTNEKCNP